MLVEIEEATAGLEAEIQNSTTQLLARLNTLQSQLGAAIAESRALTEARIDLLQTETLAGITTLEGLLIASRELAETTKLILVAAIGGVASETSSILVIIANTEASVLYNRGVLRSKAGLVSLGPSSRFALTKLKGGAPFFTKEETLSFLHLDRRKR